MKDILARSVCRILILCLGVFPLSGYAGVVTTDQLLAAEQAPAARETLRNLARRSDVRQELALIGISPDAAQARVNAMTDAEVARIAGRIDSLPAGGASIWAIIVGLLIIELIIYFWVN